jgi:hypothetical protein
MMNYPKILEVVFQDISMIIIDKIANKARQSEKLLHTYFAKSRKIRAQQLSVALNVSCFGVFTWSG